MKFKKSSAIIAAVTMCFALAGCADANVSENAEITDELNTVANESTTVSDTENTTANTSSDKYIFYVKNYVGRNCASLGDVYDYQICDSKGYGAGEIYLNLISKDGSFIDIEDEEVLKKYCVTSQSIEPGTEVKLTFFKDKDGNEIEGFVHFQSIDEIDLYISLVE